MSRILAALVCTITHCIISCSVFNEIFGISLYLGVTVCTVRSAADAVQHFLDSRCLEYNPETATSWRSPARRLRMSATAARSSLLLLPDELLVHVGQALLDRHLPSALRLCRASSSLASRLASVKKNAHARRLQWEPIGSAGNADALITNGGRTAHYSHTGWTSGPLLPVNRHCSWSVMLDGFSGDVVIGAGGMPSRFMVGVCDGQCRHGWGLFWPNGTLFRIDRNGIRLPHPPPLDGFPDGHGTRICLPLVDLQFPGKVHVLFDASAGTLAFRVNDGELLRALSGFPRDRAMRPWVRVYCHAGDVAEISRYVRLERPAPIVSK